MRHRWWNDWLFWIAMTLGPLFWIWAVNWNSQAFDISWISTNWQRYLLLTLVYPILEEIVFRGLIQEYFLKLRYCAMKKFGVSNANIATSVIFCLVHLVNNSAWISFLVFFPSIVFGYLRDRHDSVVPAIFLHVFYNVGAVILMPKN